MNQRLEKVKEHIKRNKTAYIVGATTFVVGVATGAMAVKKYGNSTLIDSNNIKLLSPTQNENNFITTFVFPNGRRGFLVQCIETGIVYPSQRHAATFMGLNEGTLSSHLNGKYDHAQGYTFRRFTESEMN